MVGYGVSISPLIRRHIIVNAGVVFLACTLEKMRLCHSCSVRRRMMSYIIKQSVKICRIFYLITIHSLCHCRKRFSQLQTYRQVSAKLEQRSDKFLLQGVNNMSVSDVERKSCLLVFLQSSVVDCCYFGKVWDNLDVYV